MRKNEFTRYSGSLPAYYILCDRCHFKIRITKARKTWEGYLVCADRCWEPRHPQDLIKVREYIQQSREVRPEPPDRFINNFAEEDE
jgi:hypothetical protein